MRVMGAKRRLKVNVITERIFFTGPYADSAGAGSGAGADAGADACLPMNSAIHSSEAPNDPYKDGAGPRKNTRRVAAPDDAWMAPRQASKSAPLTVVPATATSWSPALSDASDRLEELELRDVVPVVSQ